MFPGSEAKLLKGLELGCSGCISAVTNVTHSLARKVFDDFENKVSQTKNEKLINKIPYINHVLANGMDTTKKPRVQHDTIHKVKGLTFDNVIVDLSTYHPETKGFEATRLAYVAYSRGKKDCWSIGTSNFRFKSSLAGIQNNRHYYLKEEDDTQRYV